MITPDEIKGLCEYELGIELQKIKDKISSTHSWKQVHPGFANRSCEYFRCAECNMQGSVISRGVMFVNKFFYVEDDLPTDERGGDWANRIYLTCEQNKHQRAVAKLSNKDWYVYLIEGIWGPLYCGATNNPIKRFILHCRHKGAKSTISNPPNKLVYVERVGSKSDALKREYAIKQLSREQKLKLISNTALEDIYKIDRKM